MDLDNVKISEHIAGAKAGNQMSFNFLLDQFWPLVYYFQLEKTANDNDAEDIAIQTFSKAFDKIESYDDQYAFTTWLLTISKNVFIDFLRKKQSSIQINNSIEREEAYGIIDDSPSPEDTIIREQNLAKLLRDIKQLKPHYQKVIHLRYFEELSYKEIAIRMDEPINNIKVKLLRAKKLLAAIIKKS
ncbi:RNA polymerase subunit sigma-70 [Tenacibaculum litopenaei]|uniref:RNA polymerase sigma factor n=1 Tax=Tenacibaculum litopenaei TaxID=396016 RepID=UPI0038941E14